METLSIEIIEIIIFAGFALPISIIDLRHYRIPDALILPCYGLLLLTGLAGPLLILGAALASSALSGVLFFAVWRLKGGLGLGDVKYAALIGFFCPLPQAWLAFFIASFLGLLAWVLSVPALRLGKNQPLAFGPFLSAGALLAKCCFAAL